MSPLCGLHIAFRHAPVNVAADLVGERPTTRQPATQGLDKPLIALPALDHFDLDFLRADRFAFADVRAGAEQFVVGLRDHGDGAGSALGLALRQQAEVRNLGGLWTSFTFSRR